MRRIELTPLEDSPGWLATVPSLPGCLTEGDTKEEALVYIQEAMEVYIETLKELGRPIPAEDEGGIIEVPSYGETSPQRIAP